MGAGYFFLGAILWVTAIIAAIGVGYRVTAFWQRRASHRAFDRMMNEYERRENRFRRD